MITDVLLINSYVVKMKSTWPRTTVYHTFQVEICLIGMSFGETVKSHPVLFFMSSTVRPSQSSMRVRPFLLSTSNTACQNQENDNNYSYHCNYFIAQNRNNLTSFLRTEKTQGKRLKISNENMSTVTTIFW